MTISRPIVGDTALIDRHGQPGGETVEATASAPTPELSRDEWEARIELDFLAFAAERGRTAEPAFTSFDAFKAKALPEPANTNWHGLFLARMHREGWLEYAGFDTSHRASSGGSALRRWAATGQTLNSYSEQAVAS